MTKGRTYEENIIFIGMGKNRGMDRVGLAMHNIIFSYNTLPDRAECTTDGTVWGRDSLFVRVGVAES